MTGDATIKIAAEHQVLTQTDNTHYMIRCTDWKRFCRSLRDCDVSGVNNYSNAGWALVGVAIGGLLAVLGLRATSDSANLPSWALPTTIAITIAAAAVALACLVMARDKIKSNRKLVSQILVEMTDVESTFADPSRANTGVR